MRYFKRVVFQLFLILFSQLKHLLSVDGAGGCGACIVLLSKHDPLRKQVEEFSVSSCLTLLCSLNGCSIVTSEGLGNSKDGFHPIHQRFAGFHASQCGFCTPGICISLFSALRNAEKTHRPDPPAGFSKLTVFEAERAIAGNLCRCTGYRSIADACKSFAADVDIEDLGINSFWTNEVPKDVKVKRLPFYNPNDEFCTYPDFLEGNKMHLDPEQYAWYTPASLEGLQSLLSSNPMKDGKRIKLVVGNTGTGYYKELETFDRYVDLRYIPELSMIRRNHEELDIGAAVTISRVIASLKDVADDLCSDGKLVFQRIAEHMERIASGFIRNSGSIGGNLMMAQRNHFPSDIATLLLAVGSTVCIATGNKDERIKLQEFLARPSLDSRSVLLSIQIPIIERQQIGETDSAVSRLLFEAYRAAPRPLGNALAYVNAAFLADLSFSTNGVVINSIQLAFGAFGTKHAIQARDVEEYLSGKTLSVAVLYKAVNLVKKAVIPEPGTSYPAYRKSLAVSFLFQFLFPFVDVGPVISNGSHDGRIHSLPEEPFADRSETSFCQAANSALLSSGKQEMESRREYYPVGEPMQKFGAAMQASGNFTFLFSIGILKYSST